MEDTSNITKYIGKELRQFDEMIHAVLKNDNVLLNEVIDFVFNKNGKKIRPTLVFLSAKAFGEPNEQTLSTAVALELLHTASLLHDDVVDESDERRSQPSVNSKFDDKTAVLSGDYFLASSLALATETNNLHILRLFTSLGKDLSKGEIQQLQVSKNKEVREDYYIEIIRQKTAALFAVCASSGAISVDASDNMIELLYKIGEYLGIIFQIKDDIFDYFPNADIGKPTGNDIREGKITLPLIYVINNNTSSENNLLIDKILNHAFTEEDIPQIVSFAVDNGGIEYAGSVMKKYKMLALELISQLENEEIKQAFTDLTDYFMQRTK